MLGRVLTDAGKHPIGYARNQAQPGSLADLLMHLNDLLVGDTAGEGFMTMLLMTVDARRQEMRWATAGHEVPLIYDPQRDEFIELKSRGMVLGIEKNNTYHEETFTDVKSGQIYPHYGYTFCGYKKVSIDGIAMV